MDGAEAVAWWLTTGIQSHANVATPNGPDRKHLYYAIDGVDLPNTKGTLHPKVDTRGEGGYVVGPGSMLPTGSYRGSLADIPNIPDALLALLPEKQEYTVEIREGEKAGAATDSELRQIAYHVTKLEQLPRVWVEGAGWRETYFRAACHLLRMVNSPDYALTEAGAYSILRAAVPTDDQWGDREVREQWESAKKSTVGQQAKPPIDEVPSLLHGPTIIALLPEQTTRGDNFIDWVMATPPAGEDALWKRRRAILVEVFRAGLTPAQAGTLVWQTPAIGDYQTNSKDPAFWAEVESARLEVEGPDAVEPPPLEERLNLQPAAALERHDLLTPAERAEVVGDLDWFGSRYLDWARSRVPMMNEPYHRINALFILSLVFSDAGFMPLPSRPVGLNLFGGVAGKSTTGKSEAVYLMESVIKACFQAIFDGDNPNIGGNASPNALIEKLIERDGKPSLFITDEAHGLFKQMSGDNSWMAGLKELLTKLYDGVVSMILRSGKKDVSGKDATTFFSAYFMGTVDGMTEVLDEAFWTSGLGPRFIWAIGKELEPDDDTHRARQVESYAPDTYDAMPKQWAAEFRARRKDLGLHGVLPLAMLHDQDALDRQTDVQKILSNVPKGHRHEELLKPTLIRLGQNIRKAAILIAMSRGAKTVSLHDQLIAMEYGEEWLANIMLLVSQTTASSQARAVDKLEMFLARQASRSAKLEAIYRYSTVPKWETDKLIDQLKAEGRIIPIKRNDKIESYAIQESRAA